MFSLASGSPCGKQNHAVWKMLGKFIKSGWATIFQFDTFITIFTMILEITGKSDLVAEFQKEFGFLGYLRKF